MVHRPISDPEDLGDHLQLALSVELSTVPPYLCALYSIVGRSSDAAMTVRSVVVEEMLHMAIVGNLMNAIGRQPQLRAEFVPRYPGFIPHHAAGGPFIQLGPLTAELARTVFMEIERPEASRESPAEGDEFHTIGQFYKAIEEGFEVCADADPSLFEPDPPRPQRTDTYFAVGGGKLVEVHDLQGAKEALDQITEQGEGALYPGTPLPGQERFGDYNNWGPRVDGSYGPIVGTSWELSHYRKFQQLADGETPVPPTYPMQPNPSADALPEKLRPLSELFDGCYTLLLRSIERTLSSPASDPRYFKVAFPLMQSALPELATLLMRTPLHRDADPLLGPTAGPAFLYRRASADALLKVAQTLSERPPDLGADYREAWDAAMFATVIALQGSARPVLSAPDKPLTGSRVW